ncbi:adenylate/guanylate cyclase domain-containing protein [Spirulina sp. CS-785/01]|uniref:CHASE2 domain-containing protein n=1 Tax=Spirulina sp. CS-785/01 TaxID=3021716 RepID=UPI00232BACF1|nr:adenylate/guanylate cyclase domain-containing protein [Spirulina sp. CS-785/01]MDB9315980.1 adenylate/guanylate cyclase domain-containing protein [Spirulina sp. CS-785/01]
MNWEQWKTGLWQWRGVWITAPTVTLIVILLRWAGLLQALEWSAYDQFLRLRPAAETDSRIAIVGITEDDYRQLEQVILPDQIYADLIRKLNAQDPLVIGLDIYRDQPVNPGHQELVEVFETTPNLIGIEKVIGDRARETVGPPPVLAEKGQIASNDVIRDADNKVRRGLIGVFRGENGEEFFPSFAFYLAASYLQSQDIGINLLESEDPNSNWWEYALGETVIPRFRAHDGGYIRAEDGSYQVLLNYRGGANLFEMVSLMDVLDNNIPDDWATDRIILIGAVGESSNDFFFTPYSSGLLSLPELMAGVEVHANLTSQLLSAVLNDRPFIRTLPEAVEWLWIFFWAGVGSTVAWTMRHSGSTQNQLVKQIGGLAFAGICLWGSAYIGLVYSWWIPVIPSFVALILSTGSITAYIARTAGDIRKTFGRYLTDEVVSTLLENPEGLKMGGERRKITIFTSDLRGFTALSERLSPEEVVKILNFYLGYMADTITTYQGTIDEFMGDGILVLFGAPVPREDDSRRAIACAIAMQQAMKTVNVQMREWGLPDLEMGIGINTGEVVVGNIGSEKRTKYGIVGSQVNLTYRIESYTTGGQILVAENTLKEAGPDIKINGEKEVMPKGVKEPITIYDIGGIGGEYNLFLEKEEEVFLPLKEPLFLRYTVLDGKHISKDTLPGQLLQLSEKGAYITLKGGEQENGKSPTVTEDNPPPEKPEPLKNIKLVFVNLGDTPELQEDLYAKVLEKESQEDGGFYIQFTSKPPRINEKLQQLYDNLKQ